MIIQNIYTVEDHIYCPDGKGEIIDRYLSGLFSRIVPQVIEVGKPIDWLVIKSESLADVTGDSRDFFEEIFEKELREYNSKISVVKGHACSFGGTISKRNIEEWIKKKLKKEHFQFNYLNPPNLGFCFVGYHLSIPR